MVRLGTRQRSMASETNGAPEGAGAKRVDDRVRYLWKVRESETVLKRSFKRLKIAFRTASTFVKGDGQHEVDTVEDAEELLEMIESVVLSKRITSEWAFPAVAALGDNLVNNTRTAECARAYLAVLRFASQNEEFVRLLTSKQHTAAVRWTEQAEEIEKKLREEQERAEQRQVEQEIAREDVPRRLRLAETVLQSRTSRFVVVLERCYDSHNHQAVLRTCECLGVQHIYVIKSHVKKQKSMSKKITRQNERWLTIHEHDTTRECIDALRSEGYSIWATDLSQESVSLEPGCGLEVPRRVAVVIGRETDGVSQEMLDEADKRIFLPIFGFSDSLNLSVASALLLQRLFDMCPEARGDMDEAERAVIRKQWYLNLATSIAVRDAYFKFLNDPPPPLDTQRREDEHREVWTSSAIKRRLEQHDVVTDEGGEHDRKRQCRATPDDASST